MCAKRVKNVPGNISEQYYQISCEILSSFPKYRLPIDLYFFKEDILILAPYSRKDQRLSNEQVDEIKTYCAAGLLFVSRSDHHIYSEHMVKQLDLVLQDANLKDTEITDICMRALVLYFDEFSQSPIKSVFDPLYKALMVVTEWMWHDKHRLKYFMRRLYKPYKQSHHAVNTMIIGLWLWIETTSKDNATRRNFDRVALALLLHDIGMSKIPNFIYGKTGKMSREDRDKVLMHPFLGYKVMQKLDLAFDELTRCILEHHERLDGSGYPQKAKGEQGISTLGRLCAVADTFCAMIGERPYQNAKHLEAAAKELMESSKQFDKKFTAKIVMAVIAKEINTIPEEKPTK